MIGGLSEDKPPFFVLACNW